MVIDNLGFGESASGWKLDLNDLGFKTDEEAFAFFLLFPSESFRKLCPYSEHENGIKIMVSKVLS